MKEVKNHSSIVHSALASVLALGVATASGVAVAGDKKFEKCYGVVKAAKNDCQTSTSACAGTSKTDGQKDAWLYLPQGTCEKLVNGSSKPS